MSFRLITRSIAAIAGFSLACQSSLAEITESSNLLHIGAGGIVFPDGEEVGDQWRRFTINLIDGGNAYGWASMEDEAAPHTLEFEMASLSHVEKFVLDSSFSNSTAYDKKSSFPYEAAPARRFVLFGSPTAQGEDFSEVLAGELPPSVRKEFLLDSPVTVRRLRLRILDNWGTHSRTALSEVEAHGRPREPAQRNDETQSINGIYDHVYGPIVLWRSGRKVDGCYLDGEGLLRGFIDGRVIRLAYLETTSERMGTAVFVPAHDRLFGFWFDHKNRMGSPWNAPKIGDLKHNLGGCTGYVPSS